MIRAALLVVLVSCSSSKPAAQAPARLTVTIVDREQTYGTLAMGSDDCIAWPSPELRERGDQFSWQRGFKPRNGDVGVVLEAAEHCMGDDTVLVLDVRGNIVPISVKGVSGWKPGAMPIIPSPELARKTAK